MLRSSELEYRAVILGVGYREHTGVIGDVIIVSEGKGIPYGLEH